MTTFQLGAELDISGKATASKGIDRKTNFQFGLFHGKKAVVLQTRHFGLAEGAKLSLGELVRDKNRKLWVKITAWADVHGIGHPQTGNLNHKLNLPWTGNHVVVDIPKNGEVIKKEDVKIAREGGPLAAWPPTKTYTRKGYADSEVYTNHTTKKSFRVTKPSGSGGLFQGAGANEQEVAAIRGKTVKGDVLTGARLSKWTLTATIYTWKNGYKTPKVIDLCGRNWAGGKTIFQALQATHVEPEGIQFVQLDGDKKPFWYAGFRLDGSTGRRFVWVRIVTE